MNFEKITAFILFPLLVASVSFGQCLKESFLAKTNSSNVNYKKFNINNLSTFIYSDGRADVNGGTAGFQFPKSSNKYAIYSSGLFIAGKTDDVISVCGVMYGSNLVIGAIGENWLDNSWDSTGIWRVRPDYKTASCTEEGEDEYKTPNQVRSEYKNDWTCWPAERGATYQDVNANGIYDPEIDIAGISGADQTLWFVVNAADSTTTKTYFESGPMDVEIQATVWGYKDNSYRDNVLFKKFILINKGTKEITDMYFSQYVDPDIGSAGDDFAGCDTTLQLAYAYNGALNDRDYETTPPAVGFVFLKGAESTEGYKGMTSFVYWMCGTSTPEFHCPDLDEYQGGLEIYNYMQGKMATGEYIKIPDELGGGHIKYRAPGDPVTGSGWVDGVYVDPTSDRYFLASTGPFYLAPGDTTEIILAQLAAGGREGVDHLQAVSELKEIARQVQSDYGFITSTDRVESIPTQIKLYQNYPNPFNPKSKIKYEIAKSGIVELVVYDILGREVVQLVNESKPVGRYEVEIDGENLASGIYFYELRMNEYREQRKMILLK